MARTAKPPFIDAGDYGLLGSMPLHPPFAFQGVKMMIFPLRANIARLNDFCRSYLTIKDSQGDVFKPAGAYVFMYVLHYDKMGSSAVRQARNIGWIAQHEITFTVPLEWWRWSGGSRGSGELEFHDWAIVSPFIYVDDAISQFTGREVYGWPKVTGDLFVDPQFWMRFPTDPAPVLSFSTYTHPRFFQGRLTSRQPLFEIHQQPAAMAARLPPLASPPWAPWNLMANIATSSLTSWNHLLEEGLGLALRGYEQEADRASFLFAAGQKAFHTMRRATTGTIDPLWWLRLLRSSSGAADSAGRTSPARALSINNITVKQFPDIQRPNLACYQALINSEMGIQRLQAAGLLGEANVCMGDTSGGYSIRIHDSILHPIVDSLGLVVDRRQPADSDHGVATLTPLFPYWSDIDLHYGLGHILTEQSLPMHVEPTGSTTNGMAEAVESRYSYNAIIGAAAAPVEGPFDVPDAFIQIYPIEADRAKVLELIKAYSSPQLEACLDKRLKLWVSDAQKNPPTCTLYLVVKNVDGNRDQVWSESASPDWLTASSLEIVIPAVITSLDDADEGYEYQGNPSAKQGDDVVLVAPYVFNSSSRATISDREVNGRPTQKCLIESSNDLNADGNSAYIPFTRTAVSVESFASFGDGEEASLRPLIEIAPSTTYYAPESQASPKKEQGHNSIFKMADIYKTSLFALPQDTTQSQQNVDDKDRRQPDFKRSIQHIGLKQYRDVEDASRACYQAVVKRITSIFEMKDYGPIAEPVVIKIHKSASLPIVEELGLISRLATESSQSGIVFEIQPQSEACWFRVSLREELGVIVAQHDPKAGWLRNRLGPPPSSIPKPCTHQDILNVISSIRDRNKPIL